MGLHWIFLFLGYLPLPGKVAEGIPEVLSLRERARIRDHWLDIRLKSLVPQLMRREGIDMWVLIAREYNEDPVVKTMLPARWLSARRRTILLFYDPGPEAAVERYAITRYDIDYYFKSIWDKSKTPDQWERLIQVIEEKNPRKLALNWSADFALADGLPHSEYQAFWQRLPQRFRGRVVSGERLALGWLETRTLQEYCHYPKICAMAHELIAEGFSSKVVRPGITTTRMVEWFLRERVREKKLLAWFHPSVSIQRKGRPEHSGSFSGHDEPGIIEYGDLLHVDFGIEYLGLHTDTQQHAYVLRPGERDAPKGLRDALAVGNRLQDILTAQFQAGKTGNQILADALKTAAAENIKATIYTHPIGFHGHGAGPTIGLWDQQEGVPGKGDYPLYPNTAFSIELNAAVFIPEWEKEIRVMLEEDGYYLEDGFRYLDGRQTSLILIRP